ncbi:nitrite reductase small subunit NirD [Xanthomonas campestris]|uniref:nitrite reductase small subunit NirD n=1 Tax=Xanthomonas campestris TaxID=339 RepID=UPI00178231C9|nr:nitrite reductase small subunit NirD [Xanthomonas campestris]QOF03456.1 nitrite reductase small subunit NirD [Xanthomonas campestris]
MSMAENAWVRVCALQELPELGARVLDVEGLPPIAIFRTASDQVFALRDRCPHKGGPLSQGIVAGEAVTCPLHGWAIALQSGQACAPDVGCAPRYPVKVEAGAVWIVLQPVLQADAVAEPAA